MTPYVSPVRGLRVTSFFGPRDGKFHPGIDVVSSDPTGLVTSMTNGTVVAEWTYEPAKVKRTGNTVVTQNVMVVGDDGVAVLYSGLANKAKNEPTLVGSRVAAGTTIGAGGNTDNDTYHTHIEAITPEGVAKMGLSPGVDSQGNAIWLFEGVPVSKLNSPNIGQRYTDTTRDFSKANNSNGDIYKLSYLIPPDVVVPWSRSQVDGGKHSQEGSWTPETLDAVNRFRAATWGEAAQLVSFPDVAQLAQQLTTEKHFRNAPAPNGESGIVNALAPFESRRTDASRPVPYLGSTNAAQQLFAQVSPSGVPAVPSGVSPSGAINLTRDAFDGRFGKWGSSSASIAPQSAPDLPDSFNNRFGNWGSVPAGDSDIPRSPVLRELQKYRRSMAPNGSVPSSAQSASSATPAFQPDAVYSPAGDFYGNFPGASAAAPSPKAFNAPAFGSDPRTANDANAVAQRLARLFHGFGQFVEDSLVSPAEAAPLPRVLSGPTAPDLPHDEAPAVVSKRPEQYLSARVVYPSPASARDAAAPVAPDVQGSFKGRFGDWVGTAARNSDQLAQVPQAEPVLSLVSGKPIPNYPIPPSIWGFPDSSTTTSDSVEDWFNRWIRPYVER